MTFQKGHTLSKGNPHAKHVARLRSALVRSITDDNIKEVVASLLDAARGGDVHAARLLLEYTVGRPRAQDELADRPVVLINMPVSVLTHAPAPIYSSVHDELPTTAPAALLDAASSINSRPARDGDGDTTE